MNKRVDTPSDPRLQLSQALTPEVLRGFRAMASALTAPQAEHPDVRAACEWLATGSTSAGNQAALDSPPSLSPEQGAALSRYFLVRDGGAFQSCVLRGDEDDHLAEMIDAFDAFFVMSRAKLGHDRVPIGIWETYIMIKRRNALVGASHG